jgi:hypothetical protein
LVAAAFVSTEFCAPVSTRPLICGGSVSTKYSTTAQHTDLHAIELEGEVEHRHRDQHLREVLHGLQRESGVSGGRRQALRTHVSEVVVDVLSADLLRDLGLDGRVHHIHWYAQE